MKDNKHNANNKKDLQGAIGSYINDSRLASEGALEAKYARSIKNYYGEALGNEREGFSQHVSNVTFDAVESIKARLLDCFSGARNVVYFTPRDQDDILAAELRNAYMKQLFWDKNNGYDLIHDAIHNAALAKNATFRTFWKEKYKTDTKTVKGTAAEIIAVDAQLKQKGYEPISTVESSLQIINGEEVDNEIVEITYKKVIDMSHVSARVVAPERFLVDPSATCLEDASYIAERRDMTSSDLVSLGANVDDIKKSSGARWSGMVAEDARLGTDQSQRFGDVKQSQDQEEFEVYDGYVMYDYDGDGISELYKVLTDMAGNFLIDPQKVDSYDFVTVPLLKIPHKLFGISIAELLFDQQVSQSNVMRQQIDHVARVNTGRAIVDFTAIRNPMDMVNNEIGGLIDAKFTGGKAPYVPLPQDNLSPTTSVTLEELKKETEMRSGMSRLAQGANQDVVSKQNSADLISQMTNASTARIMTMARTFAESGLKPLFQKMFEMAVKYDKKPIMLSVGGQYHSVSPNDLGCENEVIVDIATTNEAAANKAQTLLGLHQTLINDPEARMLYTEGNKYTAMAEILKLNGLEPSLYLQNPESPEAKQTYSMLSEQNMMLQQSLQQAQAMQMQMQQQLMAMQQQLADRSFEKEMETQKFALDKADKIMDNEREEKELKLKEKEISLKYDSKEENKGE